MATLREKRPGVWEVRIFTGTDRAGRPTQISRTVVGAKRDAQRLASEIEVNGGRSSPAGRLVDDVLDAWVEQNLGTWAPSSARDQQSRVRAIKSDPISRLPLARLSVADVERWHTRMRKAGRHDAGIKNQHGVLRAALFQAMRWGWTNHNVAAFARLRSRKKQQRSVMDVADVRRVVAAAATIDPSAELALRIAAVTGARRAELASLQWSDAVDGHLLIDSAVEVVSRGSGAPDLRNSSTKTANERRLTLDPDTLQMISVLRTEREKYGPWMFGIGPDVVSPERIGWWWKRARAISGIDIAWRLHDLRHWSATVAIGQGHDVRTVAGRLGHANPAMTLRVYAHVFASADQAIAAGLGNILKEPIALFDFS